MSSLASVTVGAIRDYSYGAAFDKYLADNKSHFWKVQLVASEDGLQRNIRKLLADRIGTTIEDKYVMSYNANLLGVRDRLEPAGSLGYDKLYIAFSPKNPKSPEYAARIAAAIAELRASGKLQQILAKYGM